MTQPHADWSVLEAAPSAYQWYADAVHGNDSNPGTLQQPFQSILKAVSASRTVPPGTPRSIVLRQGTFYQGTTTATGGTLVLGPQDGGLSITAYPGETVWISGAAPLPATLNWYACNSTSQPGNIWCAAVDATAFPAGFPGLRFNGSRLIRARYPNANPELGFGSSLRPTAWVPPHSLPTPSVWTPSEPNRTDTNNGNYNGIQFYTMGVGGGCAAYDPPAGFMCSDVT
jgi:hypothetical protein